MYNYAYFTVEEIEAQRCSASYLKPQLVREELGVNLGLPGSKVCAFNGVTLLHPQKWMEKGLDEDMAWDTSSSPPIS